MKPTVRTDTTETRTPSIEETLYGPPQHSTRRSNPEETFYGVPQHEADIVVNAEPRTAPASRYHGETGVHRGPAPVRLRPTGGGDVPMTAVKSGDKFVSDFVESCSDCGRNTVHEVEIEIRTENEHSDNAAFSREPYRVSTC